MKKIKNIQGFSLIELTIVIITIGILAAIAMQSMVVLLKDSRQIETEREMEMLADAIAGNPDITTGGFRSDFGYIGDIGSFPPNLDALTTNPGGYTTWDGPYIPPTYSQDIDDYKYDQYGSAYTYTGGITISSNGSGSTLTKKIADASNDYLLNQYNGVIKDAANNVPGTDFLDSVVVVVTIPNGVGGLLTKTYPVDSLGNFTLDSLPVGQHLLQIVYNPNVDTLQNYITVLPRHKSSRVFKFAYAYFITSSGGGGTGPGSCATEPVLTAGLLLHWNFNDTSSQFAYDVSGNNNDGILGSSTASESNDPTWTANGKYCSGLYFDGTNDVVEDLDAEDFLNGLSAVTFSVWVKSDVTGVDRGIMFTMNPDGSDENFGTRYDQSGLYGGSTSLIKSSIRSTSGYEQVEGESNSQSTGWQHIALVWSSGSSMKLYVDGYEQAIFYSNGTVSGTIANIQKFMIGRGTKGFYWMGYMDDVRLYNRALSDAEVLLLAD